MVPGAKDPLHYTVLPGPSWTSAVETHRVDGVPWVVQIDDSAIMQIDGADGCRHDLCVNGGPLAAQDNVREPVRWTEKLWEPKCGRLWGGN